MHVSPLTDQISTKFQRLYLCFRGPAFRWYPREYYATKPEVEYSNMAASILEMHVSPLPDKISAKFQRLYLCFRGPASHWDTRAYYSTKTVVEKSKMVACYLEMHVSPLQVEIWTKFERLYLCFRGPAFHWDPLEYYATKPEDSRRQTDIWKLCQGEGTLWITAKRSHV